MKPRIYSKPSRFDRVNDLGWSHGAGSKCCPFEQKVYISWINMLQNATNHGYQIDDNLRVLSFYLDTIKQLPGYSDWSLGKPLFLKCDGILAPGHLHYSYGKRYDIPYDPDNPLK